MMELTQAQGTASAALALETVRAWTLWLPAAGVTGARVDGAERRRRGWLEAREQASGLAVSGTE
jgi:hypothetical protein